jgi:ligand-binding sensor protein
LAFDFQAVLEQLERQAGLVRRFQHAWANLIVNTKGCTDYSVGQPVQFFPFCDFLRHEWRRCKKCRVGLSEVFLGEKQNSYVESAENVEEFAFASFAGLAGFAFLVVGRVFGGVGVKAVRIEQPSAS